MVFRKRAQVKKETHTGMDTCHIRKDFWLSLYSSDRKLKELNGYFRMAPGTNLLGI